MMQARRIAGGSFLAAAVSLAALAVGASAEAAPASYPGLEKIEHLVVIYLENRSFDNLYGLFPGADGVADAGAAATQVDQAGKPFAMLPPVLDTSHQPPTVDDRFPEKLPNKPFEANGFVPLTEKTGDLVHRFYQEQEQINDGAMNKFAAVSDAAGLTMSYYDASQAPLWEYARQYTLADHFFHAAFGGSLLNHFWLICACSPRYADAPPNLVAELDGGGRMVKDGAVTPDGYVVNTMQPFFQPHSASVTDVAKLLPPQSMTTIGDRLNEKGISWAWYAGGYADALAGHPGKLFQFHHQPFVYFQAYADGTPAKAEHLKDEADMMAAIADGSLPHVVFFKPYGTENEHPGYADVMAGERHAADVIKAIQASPIWPGTVIIVTYDENGGLWDHVSPPKLDRWGPGSRVPALVISPLAKRGFVDHTVYDTTSILKLIETRYDLAPLGERDGKAADLTNTLQF
jgi:phospholipase C